MIKSQRAMSLVEVTVSCAVLMLLMALVLVILRTGLSGWAKVDAQQDMVQEMQVVGGGWVREVLSSSQSGLTVTGGACALISARDATHQETLSATYGELEWRRYRVYYWQSDELWRRDLDLPAPSPAAEVLERTDLGSGKQPLSFYQSGGKRLLRGLTKVEFRRQGAVTHLTLEASRQAYGRNQPTRVELRFSAEARNQ